MFNPQLIKDELGNPIFALVPYKEYLTLLKTANQNADAQISEVTEIPLPYGGGHAINVIQLVDFSHRLFQQGINSIPIDARNEVLSKLMERYTTPESQAYPGLDILIRLYFLPKGSGYRNTRQAVRAVIDALVDTGIFILTREVFSNSHRAINALQYIPETGSRYLTQHNAIDENGESLVEQQIPLNIFSQPVKVQAKDITTITTCGQPSKRTTFSYSGSIENGITLHFVNAFSVSSENLQVILKHFNGKIAPLGASMTDPIPGGVGEFVKSLGSGLTPRHASFICAILQHENYATCSLNGNRVMVTFP